MRQRSERGKISESVTGNRIYEEVCMGLTETVNTLRQQLIRQKEQERELLHSIAVLSDYKTAEAVADMYAAEKHAYSFEGYLYQLDKLRVVLEAGVPPETAIEAVESCLDAEKIISAYKMTQVGATWIKEN